jgi:hypothetical protein
MVMVSRVFVNQRQVAHVMGKEGTVWFDAVNVMLEDCCRLLESWSSEWSGDFDDGWLARAQAWVGRPLFALRSLARKYTGI